MIPKECKRLAEVDFPIAVVSKHSAREKSIRHGHPSTLHLWWARRPLAACRAILMALLLPDPCNSNCPEDFKQRARNILPRVQGRVGAKDIDLRKELLRFIGDFANWDNSSNPTYLEAARGLVRAAHGTEPPLVVDPFAGGGSIPLEALRLGCDAFASDLNPVACLILKTMLEDIPRYGSGLPDDLRKVGTEIKAAAEEDLGDLYPTDLDESRPIAYLWARTIICDHCGAEIPLVRSFWISKKSNRPRALRHHVRRSGGGPPRVEFEIFEPKKDNDVPSGSVRRARATCLCCEKVVLPERVRAQLAAQRGGADVVFDSNGQRVHGARLLAVATLNHNNAGRQYRLPVDADYIAIWEARKRVKEITERWERHGKDGLCPIPRETLPPIGTLGFRVQRYGMSLWSDLFTARQQLAILELIKQTGNRKTQQTNVSVLAIGKLLDLGNALCAWMPEQECPSAVFKLGRVKMGWDFVEGCPLGESSGSFEVCNNNLAAGVASAYVSNPGLPVQSCDARKLPLSDESVDCWFIDPPYYNAIPYADLSDLFFVWFKRAIPDSPLMRDMFNTSNTLTPKDQEIVQDETKIIHGQPKDKGFFEDAMASAFREGRRLLVQSGIAAVVFAHKTTEGWEALLSGMIKGGWTITGSWPIATEMGHRIRARESAALATSVHLVCRPRPDDADVGDWSEVLNELPRKVGDWIERLQQEGVRGADLVFACIGPAMEIYSRYRRVEDAEDREIPLGGDPTATEPHKRGFLAYVWETVGRLALEQVLGTAEARARNGAAGALEEDSRLTALFLWTLQTTEAASNGAGSDAEKDAGADDDEDDDDEKPKKKKAGFSLIYDVARRFAQPLGIHLDKWEGRIIEIEKGIVRLIPVMERGKELFGEADAAAISRRIEQDVKASRNLSFSFMQDVGAAPEVKSRGRGKGGSKRGADGAGDPAPQAATTLDRLHAAMLLQASGQANGLRALLKEETQRGPDFLRLANALSALYPKDSEEKRLLDAMLLAVPRN